MTRHYSAAPAARASRALVGLGAALLLAVLASGCASGAAPAPTPDPFAGLADRSEKAFRLGLEAYGQGQYRDALTSFESARTLSPTDDARIVQMIDRSRAALAPSPTPVPPTPTEVPAVPTATPVLMSTLTPDTELGRRYFGQVTLSMVPGRDSDAPAATQFFYQDQIGLHIEGLKQHLRLPFTMRVFNTESSRLVAEIQSEDNATAVPTRVAQPGNLTTALANQASGLLVAAPVATPTVQDGRLARFWDTYVWYHAGGEDPGRYRLELYANGILTNSFDYTVGSVPIASPEPALTPVVEPTPAMPTVDLEPPPAPVVQPTTRPSQSTSGPGPVRAAPPEPTPFPTPTVVPTPASAYTSPVGGVVAGLDVDSSRGRFYLADTTGVIWSQDAPTGQERPTLNSPYVLDQGAPVDLAVDQSNGNLYLSMRSLPGTSRTDPPRLCAVDLQGTAVSRGTVPPGCIVVVDVNGQVIRSIPLPGAPSDLRVDYERGLAYVSIPELKALAEIDIRRGIVMTPLIGNLEQVTSLALDPNRHLLYVAHFAGQVTVIDVPTGQVSARTALTGAGLSSVATARGLAYAINTVTHEMVVYEPFSQSVTSYVLSEEPAALTASEDSGAVYVLSSRANVILQIDPTRGFELGKVLLASRSGHPAQKLSGTQTLRPRIVLDPSDQTVFASLPEVGSLAAVTMSQYPILAQAIPLMAQPDEAWADWIPGVLRPAAEAGPGQAAPSRWAQTHPFEPARATSDEENL